MIPSILVAGWCPQGLEDLTSKLPPDSPPTSVMSKESCAALKARAVVHMLRDTPSERGSTYLIVGVEPDHTWAVLMDTKYQQKGDVFTTTGCECTLTQEINVHCAQNLDPYDYIVITGKAYYDTLEINRELVTPNQSTFLRWHQASTVAELSTLKWLKHTDASVTLVDRVHLSDGRMWRPHLHMADAYYIEVTTNSVTLVESTTGRVVASVEIAGPADAQEAATAVCACLAQCPL